MSEDKGYFDKENTWHGRPVKGNMETFKKAKLKRLRVCGEDCINK
jgi:hypothetical protein